MKLKFDLEVTSFSQCTTAYHVFVLIPEILPQTDFSSLIVFLDDPNPILIVKCLYNLHQNTSKESIIHICQCQAGFIVWKSKTHWNLVSDSFNLSTESLEVIHCFMMVSPALLESATHYRSEYNYLSSLLMLHIQLHLVHTNCCQNLYLI